jgi:hypothetical protein
MVVMTLIVGALVILGAPRTAEAAAASGPVVTSPSSSTEEVPGRWPGPIAVDFTSAESGSYEVSVGCDNGYRVTFAHDVPDDGLTFSSAIPPLPVNQACGVLVQSATDERIFTHKGFVTTAANLAVQDADVSSDVFFPRKRDGYLDEIRLTFWLTQPARIQASIVSPSGSVVGILSANKRFSGANALRWDGRASSGKVPRSGRYTIRIRATNVSGEQHAAVVRVHLADLLRVVPGRVGRVAAGMTKKAALRTGALNANVRYSVPGVCARVYPLQPKPPFTWDYSVFTRRSRIVEITTNTKAIALPRGLHYGDTARQVRRAYQGRAREAVVSYGNNALLVRKGRAWMAFHFDSYKYDHGLLPRDTFRSVSVSRGRKPAGMQYDGC